MKIPTRLSALHLITAFCLSLATMAFNVAAKPAQSESGRQAENVPHDSPAKISQPEKTEERLKNWKAEFERICAQTITATALSPTQLQALISDSDDLIKRLGKVEDPWAKIYIFRLKKCSDFFKFALELQQGERQE